MACPDETSFDEIAAVSISLAGADDIRSWSSGEVTSPKIINVKQGRYERDGLFSERIFGPVRNWKCACGQYDGISYKNTVCKRCGVKVVHSAARRTRFGHIDLAVPVVHIWLHRVSPFVLANLLGIKNTKLEQVIYYRSHVVIHPGNSSLRRGALLSEEEFRKARKRHGDSFKMGTGAEALRKMLQGVDLRALARALREELGRGEIRRGCERVLKRLRVVEAVLASGNGLERMVMDAIPVIPPFLRPLAYRGEARGKVRFAASDINLLYRDIIKRNNKLRRLVYAPTPEAVLRDEKRKLQEAVDALFDNARRERPLCSRGSRKRPYKSLGDRFKGKEGRFRKSLLGKRVDFSARAVIVSGPKLELHRAGLPKKMALVLFRPFLQHELVRRGQAENPKDALRVMALEDGRVWAALEEVVRGHPVLLNRAPTLHRMNIQAFFPVLIDGEAIRLHPLACQGFNADFDGDSMAVHLPLSIEARAEAASLLLSTNNIFSPASGAPAVAPDQDIVLGCYYLTREIGKRQGRTKAFSCPEEVFLALESGKAGKHERIRLRIKDRSVLGVSGRRDAARHLFETTAGRVIFNDVLPLGMPYYDMTFGKTELQRLVADCERLLGRGATVALLERIKELGFHEATMSGLSIAAADLNIPASKALLVSRAEQEAGEMRRGLDPPANARAILHRNEKEELQEIEHIGAIWKRCCNRVWDEVLAALKKRERDGGPEQVNPLHCFVASGARGTREQVGQLCGMRDVVRPLKNQVFSHPIRSCLKEGLSCRELFYAAAGGRRELAGSHFGVSGAGYLTRKLVEAGQEAIVTQQDCGESAGIDKRAVDGPDGTGVSLSERIFGRTCCERILHPESGETLVVEGHLIDAKTARAIEQALPRGATVRVRSPLTCQASQGVCAKCYGMDLSTHDEVELGAAVGVVAAQSLGERGTQLTLGSGKGGSLGSSSREDGGARGIRGGLKRAEALFEARALEEPAVVAPIAGVVEISRRNGKVSLTITSAAGKKAERTVGERRALAVRNGEAVRAGAPLTRGALDPRDILRFRGAKEAATHLLEEMQAVYRREKVSVADVHFEVLIRQMFRCVRVDKPGDTRLAPGEIVCEREFERRNKEALAKSGRPASASPVLLGITKASLHAAGWLAAASFQETVKALTAAAAAGRRDELQGTKSRVVLGLRLPTAGRAAP